MYQKTTDSSFLLYGTTEKLRANLSEYQDLQIPLFQEGFNIMHYCDSEVMISGTGVVTIYVAPPLSNRQIYSQNTQNTIIPIPFVLHKTVSLKEGVPFALVGVTKDAQVRVQTKNKHNITTIQIPWTKRDSIKPVFSISDIFAYYYNIKAPDYYFNGEKHYYFELTFVDNGRLENDVDGNITILDDYELMVFCRHQFHKQRVVSEKSTSYLTIMFDMDIDDYTFLINRKFKVDKTIAFCLNEFVKTSESFKQESSQQLISYLRLIISSLLSYEEKSTNNQISVLQQNYKNQMFENILEYIETNINEPIKIEDICKEFSISRSSLQNLFKGITKTAPKQYISEAKLRQSKLLIREKKYSISEIAIMLGFGSIHYFSRKFTARYKQTPSDYAKAVYDREQVSGS